MNLEQIESALDAIVNLLKLQIKAFKDTGVGPAYNELIEPASALGVKEDFLSTLTDAINSLDCTANNGTSERVIEIVNRLKQRRLILRLVDLFLTTPPSDLPGGAVTAYATTRAMSLLEDGVQEKPELTFAEYQKQVMTTAVFSPKAKYVYPILGLIGEVGEFVEKWICATYFANCPRPTDPKILAVLEVMNKSVELGKAAEYLKKQLRDKPEENKEVIDYLAQTFTEVRPAHIAGLSKEAGDVSWYLSALLTSAGLEFGEVAQENLDKLAARKAKGTIQGSGDTR